MRPVEEVHYPFGTPAKERVEGQDLRIFRDEPQPRLVGVRGERVENRREEHSHEKAREGAAESAGDVAPGDVVADQKTRDDAQ